MESSNGNKVSLSFQPSKNFFEGYKGFFTFLGLISLALIISSCAQSVSENIGHGSGYMFRSGYPEVRMSAIGLFDEQGNSGINVAADIVYGSLIYSQQDGRQTAKITIATRIVKTDGDTDQTVVQETYSLAVAEGNQQNIHASQDVFTFEHRYPVEPGKYTVYLSVVDQSSRKQTTRKTQTAIPSPEIQTPTITNIRLLGKDNQSSVPSFQPITTYDVRNRVDSLKFIFQVTNGDPRDTVIINSELMRFKSDTTHARPMAYPQPSPSTLEYKGIDYDERESIQTSRRVLTQTGSVLVEFIFPMQERGNYRFAVRLENREENNFKARDFGIKSRNYPTVKTPRELARPLAYLMGQNEYENLLSIKDSDSLKQQIDTFWLKNIGNKSTAKQVISLYYQRVEEANKQFSNFKEGWKTDPGMMYILFGRPISYNEHIDQMVWYYSYDRGNPRKTFEFEKPRLRQSEFPFDHFILIRNFYYDIIEYQQQQLWLNGLILTRGI